jgi:signal peptidase I
MEQSMHQETEAPDTKAVPQGAEAPDTTDVPQESGVLDTEEQTRQAAPRNTKEQKRTVLRFVCKLAVLVLVVWAVFTFVFGIRQVSGETMYPMLRDGDLILYYRLEGDYQIDDVVAFRLDGEPVEARIVARGGDVVDMTDEGKLKVNGNIEDEDIFYSTRPASFSDISFPYTVEEDSYFVLSDFRTAGYDSRTFGAVARQDLDGKVITLLRRRGI